jgi:signal transduction histidine kinase
VQQRIRALVANDATTYLANENGDFWAAYGGSVVRAPHGVRNAVALLEYERDGAGAQLAAHARVAGTPWLVVLEISRLAMRERPTVFLKRMSFIAAVLVAVGAAAAWMLSRHVTRPLAALTSAAEGMSLGDYSRRVAVKRRDEFGHLSETFNVMASRVSESREELQRQIEASRALAAELEDASRAKSDFLAVMSHELRTPLNAIGGYVDLIDLGLRGPVTPAQRTDLERIRRNQHHLLGIINNILSYARIEATQVPYTLERVPVTAILEDVQTLIEPQMREKGIRYDCRSGDATLAVRADRGQAGQIVLNLLSNAVRFTAAGGTVKVRCESDDDTIRVVVADTGIGIPRDKLETIFEPFVQVKTGLTRPADGTGLGLTISRELARGMGGDVVSSSVEGRGSTFVLTLRRAEANASVSCVTARRTADSANSPATIRT